MNIPIKRSLLLGQMTSAAIARLYAGLDTLVEEEKLDYNTIYEYLLRRIYPNLPSELILFLVNIVGRTDFKKHFVLCRNTSVTIKAFEYNEYRYRMFAFNLVWELTMYLGPYNYLYIITNDLDQVCELRKMMRNLRNGIIPKSYKINGVCINTNGNPIGQICRYLLHTKYRIYANLAETFVTELAEKIVCHVSRPEIKVLGIMSGSGILEKNLESTLTKIDPHHCVRITDNYCEKIIPIKPANLINIEKLNCLDAVKKYPDSNVLLMAYPRDSGNTESFTENVIYQTIALFKLNQPRGIIITIMPDRDDNYCVKEWFWQNVKLIDQCSEYQTYEFFNDGAFIFRFDPKCGSNNCEERGKYRCSHCKIVYYCSKKCQESSWGKHKKICCKYCD